MESQAMQRECLPRIGFLGVGWIGSKRLEALASTNCAEIAGIADSHPECLSQGGLLVPHAAQVTSLAALMELELDGIVISTPNAAHAIQSMECLEAGISVFCQKPLGRNLFEIDRIIDCAKQNDMLLDVDLSYRHLPGLQKAREDILAGKLGQVFAADFVFHNAYGPDKAWFYDKTISGGGCLLDLGIHLIDAALWVLEAQVEEVQGQAFARGERVFGGKEIEDYASACISLSNGTSVRLACSWRLHAGQDAIIEFSFFGTEGGIAVKNICGSFFDFVSEIYRGTKRSEFISANPLWQQGAIVRWCRQLRESSRYRPEIESQRDVAQVIEAIYNGHCDEAHSPSGSLQRSVTAN